MKMNGPVHRELFNALTLAFQKAGQNQNVSQINAMTVVNAIDQHPNMKVVQVGVRPKRDKADDHGPMAG